MQATSAPTVSSNIQDPDVASVFDRYPAEVQSRLRHLRELIVQVANNIDVPIVETLKWGEPAYLPKQPRTGTTVRLGFSKDVVGQCAMYVNCRTVLVEQYQTLFPDDFDTSGTRAILLKPEQPLPIDALAVCIELALTYHRRKRASST